VRWPWPGIIGFYDGGFICDPALGWLESKDTLLA
jgi:hypothetical protein